MATSRRRERELARRRFERRRQAELERRAKTKKRNTVIGAVVATVVIIGALVGGGFALFGGSGKAKPKAVSAAATPTPTPSPTASTTVLTTPKKCAAITPNPPAKGEPKVPDYTGKVGTKLVTKDVKLGHGKAVKSGDDIVVKYIGLNCSTGKAFESSYTDPVNPTTHHHTFPVSPIGKGMVIPGWDQGLIGMKAGGVRELIVPPSLGYGQTGSPPSIDGNETLIFLVTMVKV